ncbi:MAG: DNA repair protein RadA [Candidatus Omnitrophica bacterium]|nr:DNA repair protein RadA [Candidatus Omnitrophota bacterium]
MKTKTLYVCQECGAQSSGWLGKCSSCQSWNSFVEERINPVETPRDEMFFKQTPVLLSEVPTQDENRFKTDNEEFDRVLGGGFVPGSVTLLGGDPGIGKSTLSLQVGCLLSAKGQKILYVSGEESVKQAKMRADRLVEQGRSNLYMVNQIDLDLIIDQIKELKPDVVIVDSIQVVYKKDFSSSPGSVSQVRECASLLTQLAKTKSIAIILIGHVTKEGALAGPRVLEHLVDTVLYFEGERYSSYRILRTTKNRFGSTNELGVFEMTSNGLQEVRNPSEIFLAERAVGSSGSVVVPILEGTRPFLVEIQGLVSRANFGGVRQKTQGFDANRLALLAAVLEKKNGLSLQDKDIFLNVVGGVKVMDPAADLGAALAVASALLDKKIPSDLVVLGEVGLSSEVRSVSQVALRVNEAHKLGFKKCILPKNNLKNQKQLKSYGLEFIAVETVKEALSCL